MSEVISLINLKGGVGRIERFSYRKREFMA